MGFGGARRPAGFGARLELQYPRSLGVFDEYADAQKAVDYLSDHEFPVENCMIVGTDLKQVERVIGRLTWGRVLGGGAVSGAWFGAFIGLILSMFTQANGTFSVIISTIIIGALFGLVWSAIGYAMTQGRRDFQSVTQVIATHYEVLVEHKVAERARELLEQMPGSGPTLT